MHSEKRGEGLKREVEKKGTEEKQLKKKVSGKKGNREKRGGKKRVVKKTLRSRINSSSSGYGSRPAAKKKETSV